MSNHPNWRQPGPKTEPRRCQRWCPNCKHFFKNFGLNDCHLLNWSENPQGGDPATLRWLLRNSEESTRIDDDADNCPSFEEAP